MSKSGFPVKRTFPGEKGLYVEFFTTEDALNFYAKAQAKGSRIEMQGINTVILRFSEASLGDAS